VSRIRAVGRVVRTALHALHGLGIVLLRFPALGLAARQQRVRWWSAKLLQVLGIELRADGRLHAGATLIVANHVSWLDIAAVHAVVPHARFVSKADVKRWPLLNRLIDGAGTLYIERERSRDALRVVHQMADALRRGDTVAVFPEGTTSDGSGLLPFHANLLQAAVSSGAAVQPLALRFSDATSHVSLAVTFLDDTTLAGSLWKIACGDGLAVCVRLLSPRFAPHPDRRTLAARLRADIAAALGDRPDAVPLAQPDAARPARSGTGVSPETAQPPRP
jgi:1-acyl-sn-glycerol-3-phosphate acyltransferase